MDHNHERTAKPGRSQLILDSGVGVVDRGPEASDTRNQLGHTPNRSRRNANPGMGAGPICHSPSDPCCKVKDLNEIVWM